MKHFSKRLSANIAASVLMAGLSQSAHAYEEDTHYYYTFMAARMAGYTPAQAWRIASLDQAVDDSPQVEPLQSTASWYMKARAAADYYGAAYTIRQDNFNPYASWKPNASAIRRDFHAFRDEKYNPDPVIGYTYRDSYFADEAVKSQFNVLYLDSFRIKNPGVALHFSQDMFAHEGYYSLWGHSFSGAVPDCVGFNSELDANRNLNMATKTLADLQSWLTTSNAQPVRSWSTDQIKSIWSLIVAANPTVPMHDVHRLFSGPTSHFYDFFKHEPNLAATHNRLYSGFYGPVSGDAIPGKHLTDQLVRSQNVASTSAIAKKWFDLFDPAQFTVTYTTNPAGLQLGNGLLKMSYWDPWNSKVLPYHFLTQQTVSADGTAATFPNAPVGQLKLSLATKSWNYTSPAFGHEGDKPLNKKLTVDFQGISINCSKKLSGAAGVFYHAKFHCQLKNFPTGTMDASFIQKDATTNKSTLLWFAGGGTTPAVCYVEKLNWDSYRISNCNVWLNAGAAFGRGTLQMDRQSDGSWTLGYSVQPNNPKDTSIYSGSYHLDAADVTLTPYVATKLQ